MIKGFTSYCLNHNELSVEYLTKKFDTDINNVIDNLCKIWHKFPNPHIVNDIIITNYPNKRWYWEICDTKYKRGNYVSGDKLQKHCTSNIKEDQHISVYGHDNAWVNNIEESGSVSGGGNRLYCPLLWIELDRKDYNKRPDFHKAIKDAQTFRNTLLAKVPQAQVWVFGSGNNSAHIAINGSLFGSPIVDNRNNRVFSMLAHLLTDGLRFDIKGDVRLMSKHQLQENLMRAYPEVSITDNPQAENEFKWDSQIAESALENCDRNIYHPNALIRQPWSYHEKGGYSKSLIDFSGDFHNTPQKLDIKDQPPHLLGLYLKAWSEQNKKKKYKKKLVSEYDSSYIIEHYSEVFDGIEYMKPNSKGWIENLYNPFYEDGNHDCSININTGYMKDWGSHRYSMSFETFLLKKQNLDL